MKKQTLKKRTKKFEEKECALSNKERESENYFNNNYGITLIALVISIIVLLILAGISISMLSRRQFDIIKGYRRKNKNRIWKGTRSIITCLCRSSWR